MASDTIVAVILGAQDFTKAGMASDEAFKVSADNFRSYLLGDAGLALDAENVLDLFDSPLSPSEIDQRLDEFLQSRTSALKAQGKAIADVLVYYTGHGAFAEGNDEYVLALRAT